LTKDKWTREKDGKKEGSGKVEDKEDERGEDINC